MNDQVQLYIEQRDLKALNQSFLKFLTPIALEATYSLIVAEGISISGADFGSLFLKDGAKLNRVFADPPTLYKNQIRPKGFTYRASLNKFPSIVRIRQLERLHPNIKDMGIKATIHVPLVNQNKSIGLLALDFLRERDDYSKEMMLMRLFSNVASLAIHKAQLYREAEQMLQERDDFMSLAAHEIRTPLTVVLLYAELIGKSIANNVIPQVKWSHHVVNEAKRLKKITDDLLSIEQGKNGHWDYRFRQVKFVDLITQALDEFKAVHENTIRYENYVKGDSELIADKDKVKQVIINILNNASKYSPDKSEIEITLFEKQEQLILSIRDKGVGIKKSELNKIFEKYYQSNTLSRKGLGLGLYLARVIMEMHKGTILVKSKIDKGTEMLIKLPKVNRKVFRHINESNGKRFVGSPNTF